jgi:uncharacterized protein YbjT (DUF2867 family)
MKAVVIGGTGLTGSCLLNKLSQNKDFEEITVIVRRPVSHPDHKIVPLIADFESIKNISLSADTAFSCLGTTIKTAGSGENFRRVDFGYNLAFAEACKNSGVSTFILMSALGADPTSGVFYNRVKGEIENAIKNLEFKKLVILRPSLLEGPRREQRTGELIARRVMSLVNPLLKGKLRRYRSVHIESVAEAMISAATDCTSGLKIIENEEIQTYGL